MTAFICSLFLYVVYLFVMGSANSELSSVWSTKSLDVTNKLGSKSDFDRLYVSIFSYVFSIVYWTYLVC